MEEIKTLYTQTKTHTIAKPILEKFKLTESIADEQLAKINEVETLRAKYEKEKRRKPRCYPTEKQNF